MRRVELNSSKNLLKELNTNTSRALSTNGPAAVELCSSLESQIQTRIGPCSPNRFHHSLTFLGHIRITFYGSNDLFQRGYFTSKIKSVNFCRITYCSVTSSMTYWFPSLGLGTVFFSKM